MRVLLTGHDGYIGAVMLPILQAAGHDVEGLDTFYFEGCGVDSGVAKPLSMRRDLRDIAPADLEGFDAVAHLAALCNDPLGDLNPNWTHDINQTATIHLAEMAKQAGVKRFLYASSCSMYGAAGEGLVSEEAPLQPLTPYAVSKVGAEEGLKRLASDDFSPVFMRNATAYGMSPRLRADVVLNNLVCWAHTTGKVRIMSDGTPWRPIVHIQDISRAFAAVLDAPQEAIHNEAFNIGANEENYQVRDLAEIVRETVAGCVVEYAEEGGPDPRSYRVDFSKFARALPDFKTIWNARLGAQELYAAVRDAGLSLEEFQGRKFTRLAQFKYLLGANHLDDTLRWREANTTAHV